MKIAAEKTLGREASGIGWAIGRPLLESAARAVPRIGSQGVGY